VKKIHLGRNSKKPVGDGFETITDDPAIHQQWIDHGDCVGLMLGANGLSAVDFDKKWAAREWWATHVKGNIFNVASETAHGIHLVFRGETRTRKFEHGDIKSGNGYLVWPPSVVSGWRYRFIAEYEMKPFEELKPFPEDLFPDAQCEKHCAGKMAGSIRDLRRYIRAIRSLEGQNGSGACFRVACLLRDSGLNEAEAFAEMIEWSRECAEPEWTVRELLHKVRDAYGKTLEKSVDAR
jgi:hypothetical protein